MKESLAGMRICYFGHYKPEYSRNRIIMKALRKAGAEIIEVNNQSPGILRFPILFSRGMRQKFDLMIVGFLGHSDMPLARLVCTIKRVPLLFDAYTSLYEANVQDRRLCRPKSLSAQRWYYIDYIACRLADIVLLDTNTHIQYFGKTFGIPTNKFRRIWVGADDEIMSSPEKRPDRSEFVVFFYGSFIPLHGLEYIIEAAKILKEKGEHVRFEIVGGGQTYTEIRNTVDKRNINNVHFMGRVHYKELPSLISQSDLCLGIFGLTPKAQRVIPNKVYDGLAMAKCVITADTPAVRETLTHGKNIWLCEPGNGKALAEGILTLKRNRDLRQDIARNGYQYFKSHFSIEALSKDLVSFINSVFNGY